MILRKFSWAARALGSIEYLDDIWHDDNPSEPSAHRSAVSEALAAKQSAFAYEEGRRHVEELDKIASTSTFMGIRLLTKSLPEASAHLPQDEALGHRMKIVGLYPDQFLFCEIC